MGNYFFFEKSSWKLNFVLKNSHHFVIYYILCNAMEIQFKKKILNIQVGRSKLSLWGQPLWGGIIFLYYFYQNEKGDHFPFLEGGSFSEGDYFHGPRFKITSKNKMNIFWNCFVNPQSSSGGGSILGKFLKIVYFSLWSKETGFPKLHIFSDFSSQSVWPNIFHWIENILLP